MNSPAFSETDKQFQGFVKTPPFAKGLKHIKLHAKPPTLSLTQFMKPFYSKCAMKANKLLPGNTFFPMSNENNVWRSNENNRK